MTTVFLSGSRRVSRLPAAVTSRLDNIISSGFEVITGDANGADKAMQRHFADRMYSSVKVYFVGDAPRNNVGGWDQEHVDVPHGFKGRDFYAQKDKHMARIADFGLIVWDGKSPGSVQNMLWLIENEKKCVVFHHPSKTFHNIRNQDDLSSVLELSDADSLEEIDRKIGIPAQLMRRFRSQRELDF